MKRLTWPLFLVTFLFLLSACSVLADPQPKVNEGIKKVKGHYIYGHEVNTFQPCGKTKVFWVVANNGLLQTLKQSHSKYTLHPYEEVFLEIESNFLPKASDGFAMDYDGQVRIFKILSIRKKSKNDCRDFGK